ncbi:ribosome maturation factor RimP [Ruminococcaceae bacterium OttesenSCG-928-L11]|nr:ribosome maturation factor RimP [Ruminococcaceae bacterium OttesenSCG-928-L11]
MAKKKDNGAPHKNTVAIAEELIAPIVEELGLRLWDVRFEKEGATWYLRYLIDKEEGITIQDCEAVNKAIDPVLDNADPIQQSYVLEVSSPGAERQLTRDWHFAECMGEPVQVRLIRPFKGRRDFVGALTDYDGDNITILLEDEPDGDPDNATEMTFTIKESAYVRLYVDFETGGFKG